MLAPSHGKNAATLPDMPDIPMAQDPDDDDNDDGTLPDMGTEMSSAGLLLKNPTLKKTNAI